MKKLIAHSETTEPVLAKHKTYSKKSLPPQHQARITSRTGTILTFTLQRESKGSDTIRVSNINAIFNIHGLAAQQVSHWLQQHTPQNLTLTQPITATHQEIIRATCKALQGQLSTLLSQETQAFEQNYQNPQLYPDPQNEQMLLMDIRDSLNTLLFET